MALASGNWFITGPDGSFRYNSSADDYIANRWPHLSGEDRRFLYQTAHARSANIHDTYDELNAEGQFEMKDETKVETHEETRGASIDILDSGYVVGIEIAEVYPNNYKRGIQSTRHALSTKAQLLKFLDKHL